MGVEPRTLEAAVWATPSEAIRAFEAAFKGTVLDRAAPGYDETRRVWNGMIDRRPGLIARCSGTADVAAAVRFARDQNLLFRSAAAGTISPASPCATEA